MASYEQGEGTGRHPPDRGFRPPIPYDNGGRIYDEPAPKSRSASPPPHSFSRPRAQRYESPGGAHPVDLPEIEGSTTTTNTTGINVAETMIPSAVRPDLLHDGGAALATEIATVRAIDLLRTAVVVGVSAIAVVEAFLGAEAEAKVEVEVEAIDAESLGFLVKNELAHYYHIRDLEDVRVIRDRQTKISRQLAFIRFPTITDSRGFLEQNFPHIYLRGKNPSSADGQGFKVRIAYSREREDRNRIRADGEWTCTTCSIVNYAGRQKCFRCQTLKPESATQLTEEDLPKVANNGDNDVSTDGTPSQFILFRGLESSVTEEVLARGVAKLYKSKSSKSSQPSGGASSSKNASKVASTTGDSNLGAREGSIRRVLLVRDRRSNDCWKYGFAEFATVEDAQSALARYNSYETFTISSKPILASYIHAGVFVPVLKPTASSERFTFSPLGNPSVKLTYWDEEAYASELKITPENPAAVDQHPTPGKPSKAAKDGEKPKKRKVESSGGSGIKKLAIASHLQFWSDRHAELHGIQRNAGPEADTSSNKQPVLVDPKVVDTKAPTSKPIQQSQSYADVNRMCCYLCMRQFKSESEVRRHEKASQLHRDNLENDALKEKALAKLAKKRDNQPSQPSAEYRDRAKERRYAFGSSNKAKEKKVPVEEEAPVIPNLSKGASLLGKMGWSAGSGLGAEGTGMTQPVAADLYVQGVGLGAQGSKLGDAVQEAGRNTRGRYDEFLEKTKDNARERYERMSEK
ncbi:hypothetical protein FQN57_006298 [Myotisia sp. PD_48]|nr:hypothetical protein FQN57_006298 [Myotisia sp. PD_48]